MAGRFFGAGAAPAADTAVQEERDAGAVPSRPPAEGEKRLALVIGNASYVAEPLANAATDANLISRVLPALGFETTRIEDADAEALRSGVIGFANSVALAGPGAVAFVYYAGHGIQVGDANYLLPVDVTAAGLATAEPKLMALSQLIALLSAARPKAAALIIDACRNAPPGFQPLSASPSGGQAATDRPPDGMLIAYSTAAGATADDGERQNGPYAAALAQELPRLLEPGVRIHDVFVTTGERVREQTGGAQSLRSICRVRCLSLPSPRKTSTGSAPGTSSKRQAWARACCRSSVPPPLALQRWPSASRGSARSPKCAPGGCMTGACNGRRCSIWTAPQRLPIASA